MNEPDLTSELDAAEEIVMGRDSTCRHCYQQIVPCPHQGIHRRNSAKPELFCKGWKHVRFIDSMPVGAHYCEGRSIMPIAEPVPEAEDEFALFAREQTAAAFGFWWNEDLHYHPVGAPPRILRRCLLCTPGCYTRPLCIDGREYDRRRRARGRRGR